MALYCLIIFSQQDSQGSWAVGSHLPPSCLHLLDTLWKPLLRTHFPAMTATGPNRLLSPFPIYYQQQLSLEHYRDSSCPTHNAYTHHYTTGAAMTDSFLLSPTPNTFAFAIFLFFSLFFFQFQKNTIQQFSKNLESGQLSKVHIFSNSGVFLQVPLLHKPFQRSH